MPRLLTAVALATAIALAGCSGSADDPADTATPRPSASAVPTGAPSPTGSSDPSATSDAQADAGVYLALGDSLAAGYQPGGAELRDSAYPALAAARIGRSGPELTVENIACSGETTTSFLEGGKCDLEGGSQMAAAEKILEERNGEIALVTIDLGGNDLLACVRGGASIDTACVTKGVATVRRNLPRILERLRAAAGDDVPVLVLGYYNPWVAAQALDQPVQGVDEAATAYADLSDTIAASAKRAGARFVGLDGAFATDDTTPTTIGGREVPTNAAKVCELTNLCTARDIHFSDEGAAVVGRLVAAAAQKAGVR